jgi:hypothetical protein
VALAVLASFATMSLAFAQTSTAVMPALYNSSGTEVNSTTASLAAGYYYLGLPSAGGHQVEYYGNGTYYDPTTMTYGGSVNDPSGMAGVSLGYNASGTTIGLPNTGAGGNAGLNWAILGIAGIVAIAGMAYLGATRRHASLA